LEDLYFYVSKTYYYISFGVILALSSQRLPFAVKSVYSSDEQLLAKEQMSLETRYPNESVNTVFKDNIY